MSDPKAAFLKNAGWQDADIKFLSGDASPRKYERLNRNGDSAILMMDPDPANLQKFLKVTNLLLEMGYSVPKPLSEDPGHEFLLLEDFGDGLFARLLEQDLSQEESLYSLAVDFLSDLRLQETPTSLPFFSSSYVLDQNAVFLDWFVPRVTGAPISDKARFFFQQIWRHLLKQLEDEAEVMLLRDFHAENLVYLPDREGLTSVGILDYQDAMTGPAAYDLVSLLQDARRHVTPSISNKMVDRYISNTGVEEQAFRRSFSILGAHRALRILGIFIRLSEQENKHRYLEFVPRMIGHLYTNLEHSELVPLKHWIKVTLGPIENKTKLWEAPL